MSLGSDAVVRAAAFASLRALASRTGGLVTREQMTQGFLYEGARIPFALRAVGIWRPSQLRAGPGAALSITTAAQRAGVVPRYNDDIGSEGWFKYKYQGQDPDHWHNRALRSAFTHALPIVYFLGVAPGLYDAAFPAYVVGDDPSGRTFTVAPDTVGLGEESLFSGGSSTPLKEYVTRTVKQRIHQRRFRELVVGAYGGRCTICSLGARDPLLGLLDAAHILPDHDKRGLPEIPNGLSLCKIHHGAYDLNILGISPEHRVRIRPDILEEHDGPMLQHGLKEMEGGKIRLPRVAAHAPNREYLAERFEGFLAA